MHKQCTLTPWRLQRGGNLMPKLPTCWRTKIKARCEHGNIINIHYLHQWETTSHRKITTYAYLPWDEHMNTGRNSKQTTCLCRGTGGKGTLPVMMSWCLMSSDVSWHIRDKFVTNAEARFNNSLRPRKPEGSLGRTAQDVHLDSHTAPELWRCRPSAQDLTP